MSQLIGMWTLQSTVTKDVFNKMAAGVKARSAHPGRVGAEPACSVVDQTKAGPDYVNPHELFEGPNSF